MKRTIALTLTALFAFALTGASPGTATIDEHGTALAAIADIEAARAEIVQIEDTSLVGHPSFLKAAQRALNAIVGRSDRFYKIDDGDPGDGNGAIGNVDRLLDRRDDTLWTPAMQGAKANLLAVVVDLHDAMHEKQMEDYETDLTEALANLALVTGRPSETGVLGGISGALANTSLGVPTGASSISGCSVPSHGPAYGVVNGHLAYVALPRKGTSKIPEQMSVSRVIVNGDAVILYTRSADQVAALCRQAHLDRTHEVRKSPSAMPVNAVSTNAISANVTFANVTSANSSFAVKTIAAASAAPSSSSPASYTEAQAHEGAAVFSANCISCHGANLQGVAAPGVAGTEFLTSAKNNKWTLADLRTLVVENMPLNNPGTLTPDQYAKVMAFLLASNCYPAGTTPFPKTDSPSFTSVHIGPVEGAKPADQKLGVCPVK